MKKKKITTINGLAVMVQNEFVRMGKRFDNVDKEVANLNNEIREIRIDIED